MGETVCELGNYMAGPKNNLQPKPLNDPRSRIAGRQEAARYARTPRGALTPRPAASRLILSAIAALLLAGPAVASELWAGSRNGFGNVSMAQFDPATGNMVMGSNVFMDYAFAGQPSQYMGFDRLGGLAFDSDGRLWAASRNGFGNVSLAQFDPATGNMIMGTNVFMDYAFAGQPSQYMGFDRLGAFAFAPGSAPAGGVPEPSTWALLITGFFLAGVACRQRRTQGDQVARAAG